MKISVLLHNAPKKGEDQNLRQVIFRVRESNNDLKVRTDLMADPTLWDESVPGYRRTTKLGKGGTKAFNDKLQDNVDFIYSDVKYRYDDIDALHETIRKKYDIMMEKKQKQQNQKRRK